MLGHDVISILLARLVRFDVQDIDGECLLLLVNLVKALPSESADSAIDICLPTFVDVAISKTPKVISCTMSSSLCWKSANHMSSMGILILSYVLYP